MVDRVVVWFSAPVQWLTVSLLDGVSSIWHRYIYLVAVQSENDRLRDKNQSLINEVNKLEEYRLENERLRSILNLRERAPSVGIVLAHVVATSPTPLFRSLRIDRGRAQGVLVGAGVVNAVGVVGRVAAVSDNWADVMLLSDANNSIDVLVQRTRSRARVRGAGKSNNFAFDVEYLGRTEKVEPGDALITSGMGRVFPKGLPVGQVVTVERGQFGLYQKVVVESWVDFSRIEEVMVLPQGWSKDATFEFEPAVGSETSVEPVSEIGTQTEASQTAPEVSPGSEIMPEVDLGVSP